MFFVSKNNTKETAGFLYSKMFLLMVEGIVIQWIITILFILSIVLLILLTYLVWTRKQSKQGNFKKNLKLFKWIQRIDILRLTKRNFDCTKVCYIWAMKYEEDDEVEPLKCRGLYYFHENCLLDWIKNTLSWPLCKGEIDRSKTDDDLSESSLTHMDNSASYGSMMQGKRIAVEFNTEGHHLSERNFIDKI